MTSTIAKVLRRSLYFLLLLVAVLVILGSIIISQLELDNYRYELEQELSAAFEQPVQIGYSQLTFHKGIALRFQDLRIGPKDALLADIPHLTATLKIAPLFDQEIFFDRIELDEPKLQFWLPIKNRPEHGTPKELSTKFGIRVLTIRDASLKLHQRDGETSDEFLNLQQLQITLRDWQPGKIGNLRIAGVIDQPEQPAEFSLDLKLPTSISPGTWRDKQIFSRLQLNNLATGSSERLPDRVNLVAELSGIPAEKARLEASLTDPSSDKALFEMTGSWKSSPAQETIDDLAGQLLSLPLAGEFQLLRNEQQQQLSGRFGAKNVPLSAQLLRRWQIPNAEKLLAGELEQLTLQLEKSWPAGQPLKGLPSFGAEITLSDLEWDGNSLRRIQDFSALLALENGQLEIRDGLLVAGRQPVFFSGRIDRPLQDPQLDLRFDLQAQLQQVADQLDLPETWSLSGPLTATLQLSGPLQQPAFQLRSDLTATDLSLGPLLQKSNQQSSLLLEGLIEKEMLQLDRLEFRLPNLTLTGNGCFSSDPQSDFFLLDIDPIELAELHPYSALAKELQLQGQLHPTLQRNDGELSVALQLADAGAHLDNIVGDLNQTNGQIDIDRQGLYFANLQARFGESAFTLDGQVGDWQSPQLELGLQAAEVRAHDLIFRNPDLSLYDLDGRLLIDGQGIRFQPVHVQLEDETAVVVTGVLDDFNNPQVRLEIEAEKANIDDVIGLFVGPRKAHAHKREDNQPGRPLLITARVKHGSIGDLRFSDAEGLIKDHAGVFTIYPLRFSSGQGFCLARIEFDRNQPKALLKISGHAEGIDATVLHQDLFKERGLINGPLRGDFYLQGNLDDGFWQSAVGGIHLQVEKGTLRKFRGLARVFSLLNVSQLLVGKLPDMDKEGMPFTLLEGSVRIADGRAYTDDLRIQSEAMNMSLVGSQSLIDGSLDYQLGVMPLRTVDKVITSIPIAGWVLAGEDKALLTAHFKIEGPSDEPTVTPIPVNTVSETVFGIFKRTLGLPGKLVKDIGSIFKPKPKKKEETE